MADAASAPLHLRGVTCTPVEVPLRYVLGTSAAAVRAAPLLLVDLQTDEGVVGRSYVFAYRRSGARAIALLVEDAVDVVRGQPLVPASLASVLERRFALLGVTGAARMGCRHSTWRRGTRTRSPPACRWPGCSAGRRGRSARTTRAAWA